MNKDAVADASTGAFKVNTLSDLDRADPVAGRVVWDAPRSIWNVVMFGGAIGLAPLFFPGQP